MSARLALVTGGTTGIGAAICRALKSAGYEVTANYVANDDEAKKFSKEAGISVFKWNVTDHDECAEGVKKIEKDLGRNVEILVNNAGITRDGMMHKMPPEDWNAVILTDLTACYNMSQAVIIPMREKGFGRIISISSINGLMGQIGQTNYSAAKAGIIGFSKALARESASKGITVNVVAPGYTETTMVKTVPDKVMEAILAQVPVGRLAKPEEIAHAVLYLASDLAAFVTGETLSVNGGYYMQ